jgi:hypothetical protein
MRPLSRNGPISFSTYTVAAALIAADLVNGDGADGRALAALVADYEVRGRPVTPPMAAEITARAWLVADGQVTSLTQPSVARLTRDFPPPVKPAAW